jgi:hypothetical protein
MQRRRRNSLRRCESQRLALRPRATAAAFSLKEMNPEQRLLAQALLATGVSHRGHAKRRRS